MSLITQSKKLIKTFVLLATILFSFQGNAKAGFELIFAPGFAPAPITDSANFQMVGYWDLRERNSFFQVTNTGGEDVRIHIQIFDVNSGCAEFDYFDTLTPFDTHVYDVSELDRNNGAALSAPDLSGGHGIVAITHVDSNDVFILQEFPVLTGNLRITDETGYEYRTNLAGSGVVFAIAEIDSTEFVIFTEGHDIINFNNVMDTSLSDVVVIAYDTIIDPGGIQPIVGEYSVRKFDDQENPISCPNVNLGCSPELDSGGLINVGINQAITNSRTGPSLCLGSDENGFIEMEAIDLETGEPQEIDGQAFNLSNLVIYKGLNNGDGIGSMDASIRSVEVEVEQIGQD